MESKEEVKEDMAKEVYEKLFNALYEDEPNYEVVDGIVACAYNSLVNKDVDENLLKVLLVHFYDEQKAIDLIVEGREEIVVAISKIANKEFNKLFEIRIKRNIGLGLL